MEILIVDDHELFRDGIKLVLGKIDEIENIETVESGAQAISMIEEGEDFDVVLLDYNLPEESGIEILKALKELAPEIPIVMLSAEESPNLIQEAINSGANGFITKNSSSEVMVSAVKLVLSGGLYIPPQVLFNNSASIQTRQPSFSPNPSPNTSPLGVKLPGTKPGQASGSQESIYGLTERQKEVLSHMSAGLSNKEIAKVLNMSPSTVKVHVSAILRELSVSNRVQAISKAKEHGIIPSNTQ